MTDFGIGAEPFFTASVLAWTQEWDLLPHLCAHCSLPV